MIAAIAAVTLASVWVYMTGGKTLQSIGLQLMSGKRDARRSGQRLKQLLMIVPFANMLERLHAFDYFQLPLSSYHMKLLILKDGDWSIERTKSEAAASIGIGYAALTGCAWLSLLAQEPLLLMMGVLFALLLVTRPFLEAGRRVEERKQQIILMLPDMLSQLMLLVGAGETVQLALARCLDGKDKDQHPLYKEWHDAVSSMRNGQSLSMAMERFNRRCAVQEVSIFTTVLLLNYRRGGEHFVLALRELSYTLWEKRKAMARMRGEQASSKLVFPLVGILLVLMVLVAAPAVLLMS
ncbi:type II secretion system F family protein [Paenibacillus alkaliterrae]|uniref:type II secretion system F family protein n=1 Tax=Paenibacillus alkaliterrae TaxID=320909 RepID=UPI001F4588FD|nr:type II secretion system F family protein [Paenibacillus alkaliterrae]MCF2940766.1 type II secretion system F family protein [Paenibacillus alkaliterrae]